MLPEAVGALFGISLLAAGEARAEVRALARGEPGVNESSVGFPAFSLGDHEHAGDAAAQALREAEVSLRAWVLFFDDELADEWVGV